MVASSLMATTRSSSSTTALEPTQGTATITAGVARQPTNLATMGLEVEAMAKEASMAGIMVQVGSTLNPSLNADPIILWQSRLLW